MLLHLHTTTLLKILIAGILTGVLVLFVLLFFATRTPAEPKPLPVSPLYKKSDLSTEERVADLLSYMTLEEKIGQMALVEKNSIEDLEDVGTYGLGGVLSGFGGKPEDTTALGWKNMIAGFVTKSESSRLGIPILYGVDAIHGHSNIPGATVFPHAIGLGASGNVSLVERVARATGEEMLATGARWSYSPTYDMPEDIRWGRTYEAFSDDPTLVSRLGSAYITGLQENAESSTTIRVLATPKHFIGAGGMLWDTSSNENFTLDQGVTPADDVTLRTRYLPPFQKAVDSGALSVMVGLNSWDDTKLAASSYLIQTVLKDELQFRGFVVSDWYGVYEIPGGNYRAAVTAISAGVDMVMLPFDYEEFVKNVRRAVRNGDISEERIDNAVTRILTAKFALGLFDESSSYSLESIGSASHRALAREAVAESLVLLKNERAILPLSKHQNVIRVAGSAAHNIGIQTGAWTVEWQGIDGNWLPGATSILEGIRASVSEDTKIEFEPLGEFATSTPKADVGIAIVGERPYAEGWGDTPNPSLGEEDLKTIERLRKSSHAIIVILVTGRPLLITEHVQDWDALVVAWLPGSEGAGVADVLFGTKPFTGTLPLPWPARVDQLPIVGGKTNDGTSPLFQRFFGL